MEVSYNDVKKSVLSMAKDSVYSTTEVANAFAELGAKGFDSAQATKALPGVLSAAAASGEDLAMVSDTVSSALNAFGMEAEPVDSRSRCTSNGCKCYSCWSWRYAVQL